MAVSGEDGNYEVSDLAADAKLSVEGLEWPGYISASKPPIAREGETLRVADFVVKRRGARFVGRVVDAEGKKAAETTIATLRAESADAGDQAAASEWLVREKAEAGGITPETVTRYLAMARVARALKLPEAVGLLDFAAQFADQLPPKTRLSSASIWGASLSRSGERS